METRTKPSRSALAFRKNRPTEPVNHLQTESLIACHQQFDLISAAKGLTSATSQDEVHHSKVNDLIKMDEADESSINSSNRTLIAGCWVAVGQRAGTGGSRTLPTVPLFDLCQLHWRWLQSSAALAQSPR